MSSHQSTGINDESPSKLGKPDRSLPRDMASDCTPDLTRCFVGWVDRGALCYAGVDYSGSPPHLACSSRIRFEYLICRGMC